MSVWADDMTMNKRRALARTAMRHCMGQSCVARYRIGPVNLGEVKIGEVGHQSGDVAARSVDFNGNRDGVLVVFAKEQDRQLQVGGVVHPLPEFALAGGSFAGGNV